ncbi:MAG: hypothetical protein NC908_04695 [Candidatus Omnitrophica bacterium]|nr:hypothetical protein [Candidatus Omnitrophota bacterium]
MLEADLQLKKDTALATSPKTPQGKLYWDRLYSKAQELFSSQEIEIPTLIRPWITPGEIILRETPNSVYIYKATLKVILEEDYLKANKNLPDSSESIYQFSDLRLKTLNQYSSQLLKELILPKLTLLVNSSKKYAALRQAYYSLILAQWFKQRNSHNKDNPYFTLFDSYNLVGLNSKHPYLKDTYFKEYQKSFKQGEYNLQETIYTLYGQTIRNYFTGGMKLSLTIPTSPTAENTVVSSNDITSIGSFRKNR